MINQDSHYVLFTEEEMLQEYLKVIPFVTINANQQLENKVKELENERLQTIDKYHDKWLKLKQEYTLIPASQWQWFIGELKDMRKRMLNRMQERRK